MTEAVAIAGDLTIYRAAELKPLLLALPAGDAAVELDLSQVDEIDSAGIQLLLLARREAQARARGWRIHATSPAVDEALALLGLGDLVARPATGAAA